PLKTRRERIQVAGESPVTITVRSTRHGPLVNEVMGQVKPSGEANAVALSWTALMPGRTADAIFELNEARDWHEFRAAAALFEVPAQNLVYADTAGNIGYQAPGKIPVRGQGDGTVPAPGWDSSYDWTGYIDFADLPTTLNPKEGFIATANNAVVGDEYPLLLTQDWDYGYRAQRIVQQLDERLAQGKVTAADLAEIQADNFNWIASQLVPHLHDLPVKPETTQAIALLAQWDYQDDADSAAAA